MKTKVNLRQDFDKHVDRIKSAVDAKQQNTHIEAAYKWLVELIDDAYYEGGCDEW